MSAPYDWASEPDAADAPGDGAAVLREILRKLKAARIVVAGVDGLPRVEDGSDGWREAWLTDAEARAFAAIPEAPAS